MRKATQQETHDHIMGSGALSYPWWTDVDCDHKLTFAMGREAPDGWEFTIEADNPTEEGTVKATVSHADIMRAIRKIIDGKAGKYVSETCRKECRKMIFDLDYVDFDADTADQVLQVAIFGEVHYG